MGMSRYDPEGRHACSCKGSACGGGGERRYVPYPATGGVLKALRYTPLVKALRYTPLVKALRYTPLVKARTRVGGRR